MTHTLEISPGLTVRGFTPPLLLGEFKLLAFGMDSPMLCPGAAELVNACKASGMAVNLVLGEATDSAEKLRLLQSACASLATSASHAIVIGRAPSDIAILEAAGLSVAFRAPPAVAQTASVQIDSGGLDRLLSVVTLLATSRPAGLDLSVLEKLVNHDPAKFRKFALLFISSIEAVLTEVDAAIAQGDLGQLMAMGHRAKSTARNIGAEAFADQCLQLEQWARAQDLASALEVARTLRPDFETIRLAIEQRLENSN